MKGKLPYFSHQLGAWLVRKDGRDCYIELFQQGIIETTVENGGIRTMEFDLSISFRSTMDPPELELTRSGHSNKYRFLSLRDLNSLRSSLSGLLPEAGFEEDYQVMRQVGEGCFATVVLA